MSPGDLGLVGASGIHGPAFSEDQGINTIQPSLYNGANLSQLDPGSIGVSQQMAGDSVYLSEADTAVRAGLWWDGYSYGVAGGQTEDPTGCFLAPHVPLTH